MQSYRLRHRIEFQTPTEDQDSEGEVIQTFSTLNVDGVNYNEVPAEVLTGGGSKKVNSGTEQNDYDCRINLRWFDISLADLLECRVLWDGRIYEIISAEQDRTARREWRLFCKGGIEVYQQ